VERGSRKQQHRTKNDRASDLAKRKLSRMVETLNPVFFSWVKTMPIHTTYLGYVRKHRPSLIHNLFLIYYVMRNRGNNEVAPGEWLYPYLKLRKAYNSKQERDELWKKYEENYMIQIGLSKEARTWMEKRSQEAKIGNILLVCYEKDAQHCHRRLLAEEIARRFGVEYKGELEEPAHIYSLDGKPDKFDYQ